jgi:hypothetical protein
MFCGKNTVLHVFRINLKIPLSLIGKLLAGMCAEHQGPTRPLPHPFGRGTWGSERFSD